MKDYIRHQRGRMFESNFFEFFSKVHPAAPFVLWIPIVIYVSASNLLDQTTSPTEFAALFPMGFVTWQVLEYFIHKKVFHLGDGAGKTLLLFTGASAHRFHHKYPDDDTRLVMPLAVSIGLASAIWGGAWLLHRPDLTIPWWCGLVSGYLWYDFTHWSTHNREPLTQWGRNLRAHHLMHHFGDPDTNFGLSHRWIDRLLGSFKKSSAAGK
jgi:sterol desaturase/sphingolipid hydroxylase (fatty acid hydroxylase superfamily)